jgi:hypothetical protein
MNPSSIIIIITVNMPSPPPHFYSTPSIFELGGTGQRVGVSLPFFLGVGGTGSWVEISLPPLDFHRFFLHIIFHPQAL